MVQSSLPWDGEITGDCGAYSADVWDNMMEETLLGGQAGTEGVIAGVASELLPSTPGTVRVDVAAGRAIVKGKYYRNTVTVPVPIPLVAGGAGHTRIDRVVLRAAWLGTTEVPASPEQTVRVFRIEGVEDSGVPPAIVPNDGDTWDLMICQASINGTTGVITITDERDFIHPIAPIYRRVGDDPDDWESDTGHGVNIYVPRRAVIQVGEVEVLVPSGGPPSYGETIVTYPIPFAHRPLVFVSSRDASPGVPMVVTSTWVAGPDDPTVVFRAGVHCLIVLGDDTPTDVNWMAIGPLA